MVPQYYSGITVDYSCNCNMEWLPSITVVLQLMKFATVICNGSPVLQLYYRWLRLHPNITATPQWHIYTSIYSHIYVYEFLYVYEFFFVLQQPEVTISLCSCSMPPSLKLVVEITAPMSWFLAWLLRLTMTKSHWRSISYLPLENHKPYPLENQLRFAIGEKSI